MSDGGEGAAREHYARAGLAGRVLAALGAADRKLTRADLAPLDQFHVGGIPASRKLAALAEPRAGERTLDIGCGLGGPARLLAEEFSLAVTAIDLTEEYCRIADALAHRTGLGGAMTVCAASALAMPFPAGSFTLAWTEHVAMNIADRPSLYREIARVLAPGGRLAIWDAVAMTPDGALHLPVPWARTMASSHLVTSGAMAEALRGAGLVERAQEDGSAEALGWIDRALAAAPAGASLRDVMGDDFVEMLANLRRNLAERRIGFLRAVWARPEV